MPEPQTIEGIDRLVAARLSDRDARYTSARRRVVRALVSASGPQSAADLQPTAGIPLSSLYRTLTLLDRSGIVERRHDTDGVARYELAEWLAGHHHHLVCLRCGEMEDVAIEAEQEQRMAEIISGIAAARGYRVTGHRVDIEGVCPQCR